MKEQLPKSLGKEFLYFIRNHPPKEFSISLRRMLLDYLASELKIGLHVDFEEFLIGLYSLFELLDKADEYYTAEEAKWDKPAE